MCQNNGLRENMKTLSDLDRLQELMSELDQLVLARKEPHLCESSDSLPQSAEGRELFAQLVCPENRNALRAWYGQIKEIQLNPFAANLKQMVERAIGEKLG
jgi:hypothetical protein